MNAALDRGTSYGKLVASITPAERDRIINEQEKKAEEQRKIMRGSTFDITV